jgi:hypothetical protein
MCGEQYELILLWESLDRLPVDEFERSIERVFNGLAMQGPWYKRWHASAHGTPFKVFDGKIVGGSMEKIRDGILKNPTSSAGYHEIFRSADRPPSGQMSLRISYGVSFTHRAASSLRLDLPPEPFKRDGDKFEIFTEIFKLLIDICDPKFGRIINDKYFATYPSRAFSGWITYHRSDAIPISIKNSGIHTEIYNNGWIGAIDELSLNAQDDKAIEQGRLMLTALPLGADGHVVDGFWSPRKRG